MAALAADLGVLRTRHAFAGRPDGWPRGECMRAVPCTLLLCGLLVSAGLAEPCSLVCVSSSSKEALRTADWVVVAKVSEIRWDVQNQLGTASIEPLALYKGKAAPRYE